MAVSKCVIVLLALVAVAAAAENARVKKQVFVAGAYPFVAPVAAVRTVVPPVGPVGEDDGSWVPNKYDPVEVVSHVAAPVAYPYAAPYAAHYAAPYAAPFAYPYAYPYAYPVADDGSYFAGKYGPESQ